MFAEETSVFQFIQYHVKKSKQYLERCSELFGLIQFNTENTKSHETAR